MATVHHLEIRGNFACWKLPRHVVGRSDSNKTWLVGRRKLESCHVWTWDAAIGYPLRIEPRGKIQHGFFGISIPGRLRWVHHTLRYANWTLSLLESFANLWILCLWPLTLPGKTPSCLSWCFSHFPQMCPKALEIHTITVDFFGSHINIPPISREFSTVHKEDGKWAPSPVTSRVVITPFVGAN